ncbi:hypothetical protein EYC80_008633 [Monilinia laxa]|uniref:Peroxisomal biogenesis factor 11 n=1 Tax=Monilinia laxa TaxID=61186 RepID=A0A5N6K132_MONLA|nr:hypothetical protein EYC80_008633 [Monilinia laxa]
MGVIKHAIDFASDAAGLEKSLRLMQALCQIFAFYPRVLGVVLAGVGMGGVGATGGKGVDGRIGVVEGLWRARREVAVGRRYLRFFRFIENFSKAWDSLCNEDGLKMLTGVGKSGFMGAYLGLESLTILDMMGICSTPWSSTCILEGNKFWFYSLCISIFGGFVDLFEIYHSHDSNHVDADTPDSTSTQNPTTTSQNIEDKPPSIAPISSSEITRPNSKRQKARSTTEILLKIIENAADLIIPGAVTGWIITDAGIIGVATVISTVLSSGEIWRRVGDGKL